MLYNTWNSIMLLKYAAIFSWHCLLMHLKDLYLYVLNFFHVCFSYIFLIFIFIDSYFILIDTYFCCCWIIFQTSQVTQLLILLFNNFEGFYSSCYRNRFFELLFNHWNTVLQNFLTKTFWYILFFIVICNM